MTNTMIDLFHMCWFLYLMPDNRGRRLKHRSLDWNFKQSFQARTVGSQLQLIVLKNTTAGHSIVLGYTRLEIMRKT